MKINKTFTAIILMLSAAALAAFLIGCGEEAAQQSNTATGASTGTGKKPLTQEYVTEMAGYRIGGERLVRKVTISGDAQNKQIEIHVDRPEVCHDGAVVGTAAIFAQKVMAVLYKYPEVARIDIFIYGLEQGVVSDDLALKVSVDRQAAQKIDWFQFTDANMPKMASEYFVHPKIQTSFVTEGGDPSGPKPQTQTTAPGS